MSPAAMCRAVCTLGLACLLVLLPPAAGAKGGGIQPKPNKDFRELIVKGERPEIAACLAAAIDFARRDAVYSAIRWDDQASDRAVMREVETNGRLTRYIRLTAELRTQGTALFAGAWRPAEISCEQPEDGAVRVSVKPIAG